ncbi:MAG: hypothetical protein KDK78_09550, partial [Chlamydiia bacterium]|nr:hypothetical protein [Chlamydiia bacterium]
MSGANYHSDLRTRLGRDYTSLARWMGPGTQRGRPARSQTIGRVLQRLPTGTDGARPIARRVISLDRSNSEMLTRFGLKPSLEAVRSTLMHAPNADRWMQLSSEPIPNTVAYQVFKGDLPTARDELASRINAGEDCTLELWLLLERAGGRDVDSALQVSIVDLACKGFHTDNYPLLFNRVLNEKRPEALRALRSVFEDQMFIENISNLIHALGAEQAFRELQKLAIHPGSVFAWISEQDNRGDLVNTFARVYPQALEVLQEMRQDQLPTDALLELLHAYFDGQPSELNCLAEGALALDSPDVFEEIISLIKLTQPLLLQAPVDKYETTLLDTIFEWMPLDPWVYVAACMPTNLGVDVRRILKHCSLNPESVGDASRKVLESLFELHGQMPTTLCLRMTRESLENYAIRKLQDPVSLAIVLEHGSEWTELLDEDIFNATEDNSIKLRLLEAWLAGYSPTNPDQAELADHIAIQVNALSPEDFAVLIEGNPNIRLPLTKAMLRGMFKGQNELGFDDFKSAALEIALCEAEAALEDNRDQALLFASWRIQVASRAELTAQLHLVPGIIAVTNGATCVLDALFSKFDEYGIWMTAFESVDSDDESLPLISQLIVL